MKATSSTVCKPFAISRGRLSPYGVLIAIAAALGGLLFGYDTAVISGAILFVRQLFLLSPIQTEIAIGSVLAGCAVGSAIAGYFADRFGRKPVLIVNAVFFAVFAGATAMAHSFGAFIAARFVIGVAVGVASMLTPLYIAEVAPPRQRGMLVSLNQLAIVIGGLTAYCACYLFSGTSNWQAMFASAVIPSLVLLVALIFLPESPRWLVKNGSMEKAYQVLSRIGGPTEASTELEEVIRITREDQLRFRDLFSARFRGALIIGLGLAIFDQITGINTISYYTPIVLQMAGTHAASVVLLSTVLVGAVNLTFTILSLVLLDRVGRRPLLLSSIAVMAASLGALGYFFGAAHISHAAVLICILLYLAAFAVGLGPVFWLLISEIYPTTIRGKAMSLATVTIWIFDLLVTSTFLSLTVWVGTRYVFWLYALASIAAFIFSFSNVPETKGLTLEKIESAWKVTAEKNTTISTHRNQ